MDLEQFQDNHLQNALLDEFFSINDISNDQNEWNDHESDQGRVSKILYIYIVVCVTQLQGSCGKKEIVAIITMSEKFDFDITKYVYVIKILFILHASRIKLMKI